MAMLKTLVSLNPDLASSIALRYACRMGTVVKMALQTIHVEDPAASGHPPGTGWVRRTWEKALLKAGEEEIAQLIQAERSSCPPLAATKMVIGDPEEEILRELDRESYDLFIEGTLYSFSSTSFNKKIRSRLYRHASCPVILVKNLMDLKRIAILLGADMDPVSVVTPFLKIFSEGVFDVDLLYYRFHEGGGPTFQKQEGAEGVLSAGRKLLIEGGGIPKECRVIEDSPEKLSDLFRDYGLVVSSVHGVASKKSHLTELLHRMPSPILFCPQ
jgi:nucleotide-binding universal stress UspA family protein